MTAGGPKNRIIHDSRHGKKKDKRKDKRLSALERVWAVRVKAVKYGLVKDC